MLCHSASHRFGMHAASWWYYRCICGRPLRTQLPQLGQADAEYTWMGRINASDKVMLVHKFDPIANGIANRCWKLKDGVASMFPIWIEDIDAVKIKLIEDKVCTSRNATSVPRWIWLTSVRRSVQKRERAIHGHTASHHAHTSWKRRPNCRQKTACWIPREPY